MPIYEYRCGECQQLFEEWSKQVEESDVPRTCPICKGRALRIMSNTSFALKGGGWYVTEYGSRHKEGKDCGNAACAAGTGGTENAPACASSCSRSDTPKAAAGPSAQQ